MNDYNIGNCRNDMRPNAVVAKDGSGQYKTINDAIRNMPIQKGRYVIYVKAGVYNEIILVPKGKNDLFMYGDGSDRTIVTGDRSNTTGYKTSASATFGKLQECFSSYYKNKQNVPLVTIRSNNSTGDIYICLSHSVHSG